MNNITDFPKTQNEAVNRLLFILSDQEKKKIKTYQEDDLIWLLLDFGQMIQNGFGLNCDNTELISDCDAIDVDDCTMRIIKRLWEKLNGNLQQGNVG